MTRTREFAIRVIRLSRAMPRTDDARAVAGQLARSGTSVGANYRSARRGRSHAEFTAKPGIALEEADESAYWLDLIMATPRLPVVRVTPLFNEANELTAIFTSSMVTARGRR